MQPDAASPLHAQCYSTLLFKDSDMMWMRRAWEEDEVMVQLWARLMLKYTELPVYVMHTGVDAIEELFAGVTAGAPANRRLTFRPVNFVRGGYWGKWQHYRYMHTKLQAWNLPCKQAVFMDYDSIPLRNMDVVFDACGDAPLCGTTDVVTPKGRNTPPIINAGMMVMRPNGETFQKLVTAAEKEAAEKKKRMLAEQGFLTSYFPDWKHLKYGFHLPQWEGYRPSSVHLQGENASRSYFLHVKLSEINLGLAETLGVSSDVKAVRRRFGCRVIRKGILQVCGEKHGFNLSYYQGLPATIPQTRPRPYYETYYERAQPPNPPASPPPGVKRSAFSSQKHSTTSTTTTRSGKLRRVELHHLSSSWADQKREKLGAISS